MLSFEFTAFDLVLSVAMIVLIVLFISTLLKLNPSTDNKQPSNEEDLREEESEPAPYPPEPAYPNLPQMTRQTQPASLQNSESTRFQKPKPASGIIVNATVDDSSMETIQYTPFPTNEPRKPSERIDSKAVPTPPLNSSDEKVCPHKFGYLKRLPKNTAIPEECFGCQKIVDCLIKKKSK